MILQNIIDFFKVLSLWEKVTAGVIVALILWIVRFLYHRFKPGHLGSEAGKNIEVSVREGDSSKGDSKNMLPVIVKENPYVAKVKIKVGDYREFEWGDSLVKISLVDIVKEKFKTIIGETETFGAELGVEIGGGIVYGGKCTKECSVNHYRVPAIVSNYEEPYSLYFFHSDKNYLRFFRTFIEHINNHANEVTLNVFFFKR
jgi:hypothetical protein